MYILASKPVTGQDFKEKPERRSPVDRFEEGLNKGCYAIAEVGINNYVSLTIVNQQPRKFAGDKTAEKNLEIKGKLLDYILTQIKDDLVNKKNQVSKLRKEFETSDDKELFGQIATLDHEIRQYEAVLTGYSSHVFGSCIKDQLGISHELQELINSGFLDRLKDQRNAPKNSCKLFNRITKFTKLAHRRILEGGEALKIKYGTNIVMGTYTFPGRTEKVKQVSARYSRVIVNRLTQVIRDYAKYHGIEIDYIGCWEFHQDDFLHLHLAFGLTYFIRHRRRLEELLRECWLRILDDMATTEPLHGDDGIVSYPGVDMYERSEEAIDTEGREKIAYIKSWKDHKDYLRYKGHVVRYVKCTKNPAGYVSKYISKQASTPENPDNCYYPKSWWCISKGLSEMAKASAIKFSFPLANDDSLEICDLFINLLQDLQVNGSINQWHRKTWDIFQVIDPNHNKSTRVNRKPSEAPPPNSKRVSSGTKITLFIHPEDFPDCQEAIAAIRDIVTAVNTMPPKDFNKFHANKYYADRQETNIDNEVKAITARKHSKHRNYWEKIAAGENYQDIYL